MILAAGLGTRMRPLTESRPKPLIEVAGKPLIAYSLEALVRAGVEQAVVNLHHHPGLMRSYLNAVESPLMTLSDESDLLLDSGGGVKKALQHLGTEPFFILNADSFVIDGPQSNLLRLSETWDATRMDCLLLVASGTQVTGYSGPGDFMMDPYGHLMRRPERLMAPFVYAGVAIINPALFDGTPDTPFSLNLLFNRAIERERLFGLRLDGEWLHVGTPDAIHEAELRLQLSLL